MEQGLSVKLVVVSLLILLFSANTNAYLTKSQFPVPEAIRYLQNESNIKEFPLSVLGFGAMDLKAVNEQIPLIYKTEILNKLNDTSCAGLGIAVSGLRAMCINLNITSPKDFDNDSVKEDLAAELMNCSLQDNVFSNSLMLMGLISAGRIDSLKSYELISYILNHQDSDGCFGYSIDSHALAVMALQKIKQHNTDLVPDGIMQKAEECFLGKINKTLAAYGYVWNGFHASSTTTGLALSAISALNMSMPEYPDNITNDSDTPIEYLIKNANENGFKDSYSENQDFPNAEAFLGAVGLFYPVVPECREEFVCTKNVRIKLRIELPGRTLFRSWLDVPCTNISSIHLVNNKTSVLEALEIASKGIHHYSPFDYGIKQYSFGPYVYSIDGETGNTAKGGGVIYYIDNGSGFYVPPVGMADFDLRNDYKVLIAVINESYSQDVPSMPLPLKISLSDEAITTRESVEITVRDSKNNRVEGARIYGYNDDYRDYLGRTNEEGILEIDDIDPGNYDIWAEDFPKYIRSDKVELEVEPAKTVCYPKWKCTAWSSCNDGKKTRTCYDTNNCGSNYLKPQTEMECEIKHSKESEGESLKKVDMNLTNVPTNETGLTPKDHIKETKQHIPLNHIPAYASALIIISILFVGILIAKMLKAI